MSDLIRRSDVIEITAETGALETQIRVKALPTIEPKRGEWIYQFRDSENEEYKCSECGYPQGFESNFCPNCGAKMKGADDE